MSVTTETVTDATATTTATPSIPLARIPGDQPAAKKPSLKDRMKGMKAAPETKKPAASKRPEYDAPQDAVEAVRRFVPANLISTVAEKRAENAKTEISEVMMRAFVSALWKNKVVPSNPKIVVRDDNDQPEMSVIFQVQDRFSPNNMKLPEIKQDMEDEQIVDLIVSALIDAGVEPAFAAKFVTDEVTTAKRRNIRSLNELAEGHFGADKQWVDASEAEQAVAEKLMDFLDTLSPEEQAIIRRDETKVTVKKDMLTRVCSYTRFDKDDPRGEAQVAAFLKVFVPVNFPSHAALGLSDDEATKIAKLKQAADDIIGSVQVK
jgi:hypothetical protein